jgi:ferredoxin
MGGMRLPGLLSLCRSGRQFAMAGRTPLFLQGVLGDSVKNAAARRVSLQAFRRMSVPFRNMPWRVGTCRRSRENVGIRAGVEAPGYLRGIAVTVRFPDDTEKIVESSTGQTLLEALETADLSDVWPGGACGGSCSCSTCRVFIGEKWIDLMPPAQDDELDMLDSAVVQDAKAMGSEVEEVPGARLACQIEITGEMDGIEVVLPESMHNMLEIPLWLRNR